MHQIEQTDYGMRVTFDGFMSRQDMQAWFDDMKKDAKVAPTGDGYGVLVDLRGAVAFPVEAQEVLFDAIRMSMDRGMRRNAIIVSNAIAKIQATRIARESGIGKDNIQFFDATTTPDWEEKATSWLRNPQAVAAS
jgi:hypothetical protein